MAFLKSLTDLFVDTIKRSSNNSSNSNVNLASKYSPIASTLASNYSNLKAPASSTLTSNYVNLKAPASSTLASNFANNNASNTLLASVAPVSSTTNNNTSTLLRSVATPLQSYNTDFTNSDAYKTLQSSLGSLNAAANPIDLSGIIADYNKNNQATINTYNKALSDTINTLKTSNTQSRNDLLTSLKRFQEANAENMRMQQQDFNASRASLEDESFMNQRNTLANTSSRGLGGSGLQQLAQLQNRLAAGKNISTLAQKNQTAQDALRKALTQQQEDTTTNLSKLEANLANAITQAQNDTAAKINAANTANTNLINNLIYNEQVRQRNAQAQASSARANLNSLLSNMKQGVTTLQGAQKSFANDLESTVNSYLNSKGKSSVEKLSSKQKNELSNNLSSLYNAYVTRVGGDLENYGNVAASYGLDNSYTDTALSNLNQIYNRYKIS